MVKYDVDVDLSRCDGNAFSIMGKVTSELKRIGVSKAEIGNFRTEAMSGDYNNLLRTCAKWVNVT